MKRKTAFTLIELLVVIAIMSMLAAFLLPALGKARAKAKYARWQAYSHTLEADPELVAYYNFQEDSGSKLYNRASGLDRRGYDQEALNGTTKGGAEAHWTTTNGRWPGKGAIEFDGSNDYIDCGNDSALNITGAITIEAWGKRDVNGVKHVIASKAATVSPWDGWQLSLTTTNLFRFATTLDDVWKSTYSTSTITDSNWHHYAATFDGTTKVYIDGIDVTNTSQSGTVLGTNDNKMYIPGDAAHTNNFNGTIDEVAIYSSALSAEEIAQHYQMGKP